MHRGNQPCALAAKDANISSSSKPRRREVLILTNLSDAAPPRPGYDGALRHRPLERHPRPSRGTRTLLCGTFRLHYVTSRRPVWVGWGEADGKYIFLWATAPPPPLLRSHAPHPPATPCTQVGSDVWEIYHPRCQPKSQYCVGECAINSGRRRWAFVILCPGITVKKQNPRASKCTFLFTVIVLCDILKQISWQLYAFVDVCS